MPKVTLTAAERKAGLDLRDVLPRAKKPRVSKEAKREAAAAARVRYMLEAGLGAWAVFEVDDTEGSEREDVEVEVVVRFFVPATEIDAQLHRQTHVRGSRR